MAGVPQKTLNWLYDVLKREYRDPNRTYSDLAHVLTHNPSFAPRTDVYTFENGAPALLLQFKGTIPVHFRGNTYRFPIVLWIPHAYPYEAPMCYVTPTEEMMIRPGQHVGGDGRIYHPYLARWREHWERSNILDFMSILSDIFAKEPPVMSRSSLQQQGPTQPNPPPVPPLPREMQPPPSSNVSVSSPPPPVQYPGAPAPPPPPPKQLAQSGVPTPAPAIPGLPAASARPGRYDAPPPLPPQAQVPGQRSQQPHGNGNIQRPSSGTNFVPQRSSSLRQSMSPQPPYQQQQHPQTTYEPLPSSYPPQPPPPGQPQQYPSAQPHPSMASPPGQRPGQVSDHARPPPPDQYGQMPAAAAPPPHGQPPGRPVPQQYSANYAQQLLQQAYAPPQQQYQPPPQASAPKPAPTPNLLDSPFDIPLPAPNPRLSHNIPAPPIPVNPEKEALLSHLSHLLTTSLHQQISQNNSALAPLASQYAAMQSTASTLNSELSNLKALHATVSNNISLLQSSLTKADQAISSAHARAAKNDIPHVDEMLTAPTVVARQLYDAACEERGIEAAILALQEGFVRGRVGSEIWARRTRELAREGFKRRWMVNKVGEGMGLDLEAGAYGR
ncbi:uncharacterized protein Z520_11963 [Fonsecaea multimorphosa CBS 102226]|uniref:UEV domain-containing protein n=1 Tax=Fonsecaea multimorphosa CBS 102226 TaxID=1442371 RepID=A0A0D2GS94_9EURO|nr:uncharacterized protein Z520_11963 [Fonsecaea multimorphosa CBS 102226]KIX92355.1 hypothetical protein Z520_11963 [Fonsecaea multimorphosa CBS 102226]OAL17728.1 hypothetical protein AYO22_11384 [Fonsecaea multimorphosa]